MLRSIDLFSGIGGLALALAGVAEPVAYCDVDPAARRVLRANIEAGRLPDAQIFDDVRTMRAPRAGLVVGGFPCVGFSSMGKRALLQQKDSALFYEMLRVLDESGAHALFMENVPGVSKCIDDIAGELGRRGFVLTHATVRACDVGAPHVRSRWYGLAVRPGGAAFELAGSRAYVGQDWGADPPRRTTTAPGDQRARDRRASLLGNSVVPDAARAAFLHLSGLRVFEPAPRPVLDLVLCPEVVGRPERPSLNQRHPILDAPVRVRSWATPRRGMQRACRVLTKRSALDLPTQIKFEAATEDRESPMNPEFLEHLMGYPVGWTAAA
jgi:hypothetical protein